MNRLLLAVCALCSLIACVAAAAPESVSMPPGLVSWWKANGNANDSAGPNNGTIQGGVTFAVGHPAGKAFSFNGTTGDVRIGDPPSLHKNGGGFTVTEWVWFNALVGPKGANDPCFSPTGCDMSIVDKMSNTSGANSDGWRLLKQSDNHFWFCVGAAGNGCVAGKSTTARSTTIAKAHSWYFVTGVLSPANKLSIYVNGSRQSTATGTGLVDTDASPMFISSNGGASAFMYGKIDDIQYYNSALTAAQILQLYKMP